MNAASKNVNSTSITSVTNVTLLNQNSIYRHIVSWINDTDSPKTAHEHEDDVRLFYKIMRNKELEILELKDIQIELSDITEFKNFLRDQYVNKRGKNYKNNSITRKVNSVRSLYKYLKGNRLDVDYDMFKNVKDLRDDTQHIGFIDASEAFILGELALTEKHEGSKKRTLILAAMGSGLRKEALLNIRYGHIRQSEKDSDMYIIEADDIFDKGIKVYAEIHRVLYDMMLEFKGDKTDKDKIFNLSSSSVDRLMENVCKRAGIDPKRRISFHSLKKAGIGYILDLTGNLHDAQMQGHHVSPVTTSKFYIEKKSNLAGMALFENIDESVFDELSYDELLQMVKGIGNGLGLQLRREAKKIVEGRK